MRTTLTRAELAERWGDDVSTIIRYEKSGIIKRLPGFPTVKYSIAAIELVEAGDRDTMLDRLRRENEELRQALETKTATLETLRRLIG